MLQNFVLSNHKRTVNISTEVLDALAEKGLSSLCMISTENGDEGSGTGFFITPHGHLLTNKHVVKSNVNPIVFLAYSDRVINTSIIAMHPTEDLALLKITKPCDDNFTYLEFSSNQEEIGNWVFSLRGRGVDENRLFVFPSIGKIMGNLEKTPSGVFIVLSICGTEGNSESPVLNLEEKVVGILTYKVGIRELPGDAGFSQELLMHNLKPWIEEVLHSDGYFEKLN